MSFGDIVHAVQNYQFVLLVINLCIMLVLFIIFADFKNSLKKYRFLEKGNDDKDLETLLLNFSEKLSNSGEKIDKLEEDFNQFKNGSKGYFQKWALVRFKAFNNIGGDQSFSLALMDGYGDGLVISSIFGREESVVYCKPIKKGVSTYPLSKEEQEAIQRAANSQRED